MTPSAVLILCARVSWPVPAVQMTDVRDSWKLWRDDIPLSELRFVWRCSHCGARVKVVA